MWCYCCCWYLLWAYRPYSIVHITIATTNLWFNINMMLTQSKSMCCCRRVYFNHPKFISNMKPTIVLMPLSTIDTLSANQIELNGMDWIVSIDNESIFGGMNQGKYNLIFKYCLWIWYAFSDRPINGQQKRKFDTMLAQPCPFMFNFTKLLIDCTNMFNMIYDEIQYAAQSHKIISISSSLNRSIDRR